MNLNEINYDIEKLKSGKESYDSCSKLASLLIVRDFLANTDNVISDSVEKEYNDILPTYKKYCSAKKEYQLSKTPMENVLNELNFLCDEIKEFMETLYYSTDSDDERSKIQGVIDSLYKTLITSK